MVYGVLRVFSIVFRVGLCLQLKWVRGIGLRLAPEVAPLRVAALHGVRVERDEVVQA